MAPDVLPILAAVCLLSAFIVAARTAMAWQAIERASDAVLQRGVELEEGQQRLRESLAGFRDRLAEQNAAVEHGLWTLASFDERSLALEGALQERRAAIEDFRLRYVERADQGLRRARSTLRLLKQLLELRRTFLG